MLERNEPCWCGSGKKYKKCCLDKDGGKRPPLPSPQPPRHKRNKKPVKTNVKSPEQIDIMRRAGEFNGELLDYIRPFVKAGVVTEELNKLVHDYTIRAGHKPACLGYKGFKKSCCISRNNVVCHGIPSPKETIADGDIVNVDVTTIVNGFHGDSSETFMIGDVSDDARHLCEVAAQSLILGIKAVVPGKHISAIAQAVEPYANSQGCAVVRAYTGHGIGAKFHEYYSIYHHEDDDCDDVIMLPGMTFTVEPMINLGDCWDVTTDRKDGWTVRTKDGSLSAQFEHTVLVTETGVEILTLTPTQKAAGIVLRAGGKDYRL